MIAAWRLSGIVGHSFRSSLAFPRAVERRDPVERRELLAGGLEALLDRTAGRQPLLKTDQLLGVGGRELVQLCLRAVCLGLPLGGGGLLASPLQARRKFRAVEPEEDSFGQHLLDMLGSDRDPATAAEPGTGRADVASCSVSPRSRDERRAAEAAAEESCEQVAPGGLVRAPGRV
jgi:hypothetical protein